MKNFIILLITILSPALIAQVAIGKEAVEGSALLDFAADTQKGIILPWVDNQTITEKGSLIYSVTDKKVMFYDGAAWQDLSLKEGAVITTEIDNFDEVGEGVIIGVATSIKQGVLILEDSTKALVLPKSDKPWDNIKNPEAGTLVYDPIAKLICVYNGTEWTFWGN